MVHLGYVRFGSAPVAHSVFAALLCKRPGLLCSKLHWMCDFSTCVTQQCGCWQKCSGRSTVIGSPAAVARPQYVFFSCCGALGSA